MAEKESSLAVWLSFAAAVISAAFGLYATQLSKENEERISGLQRQLEEKKFDLERYKFVESLTERLAKESEKASDRETLISLALADFALDDKEYDRLLNALNRTGDAKLQNITNMIGQQSEQEELRKESAAPLIVGDGGNMSTGNAQGLGASGKEGEAITSSRTSGLLAELIGPDREPRINAYRALLAVPQGQAEVSVLAFLRELNADQSALTLTNAGLNNLLLYIGTRMPCWKDIPSLKAELEKLRRNTPGEIIRHLAQIGFRKIAAFDPKTGALQNNACN